MIAEISSRFISLGISHPEGEFSVFNTSDGDDMQNMGTRDFMISAQHADYKA
jgi:hypothetical protein